MQVRPLYQAGILNGHANQRVVSWCYLLSCCPGILDRTDQAGLVLTDLHGQPARPHIQGCLVHKLSSIYPVSSSWLSRLRTEVILLYQHNQYYYNLLTRNSQSFKPKPTVVQNVSKNFYTFNTKAKRQMMCRSRQSHIISAIYAPQMPARNLQARNRFIFRGITLPKMSTTFKFHFLQNGLRFSRDKKVQE